VRAEYRIQNTGDMKNSICLRKAGVEISCILDTVFLQLELDAPLEKTMICENEYRNY
jgi:hypothetical protein